MTNIILFDGVCNFCNRTVSIIIKHDQSNQFHFAQLQSDFSKELIKQFGMDPNTFNSVLFIEGNQIYTKSDAVIRIAKELSGWPRFFYFTKWIPKVIRNFIYNLIAKYRYRLFGKQENCLVPDENIQAKFLS
jgi:predicted DCC family thiol-disulfide oxidoreductase YuxK